MGEPGGEGTKRASTALGRMALGQDGIGWWLPHRRRPLQLG
jgi:hypothetical protein